VQGAERSRRTVLVGAATAVGGLAGCAGSGDGSEGTECETSVVSGGDTGGAIQQAAVDAGERATLRVVLNPEAAGGVDAIRVDGSTEDYRIPLLDETPRRVYRQSLGPLPTNGRLRVAAVNQAGEALDAITVEFRCRRSTTET
jgi:hypothetical protein